MKKKAFFVLSGFLIGALLAACGSSPAIEHYDRGYEYLQQGNFDLAIEEYTEAIALDPQFASAYNNRGFAYASQGDFDRAIADYDQAITLDPQLADAYGNRGIAYANKGDFDRSIVDVERALELGLDPSEKQDAEEFLEGMRQ